VSQHRQLVEILVAEGRADAYLRDGPTMEWDTAAAQAVLEEAGGLVLDISTGRHLTYGKMEYRNGSILAAASHTLAQNVLAAVQCLTR